MDDAVVVGGRKRFGRAGFGGIALGALSGLVAGACALAAGELVAVFAGAASAPGVAVGEWAIDLAPTAVKEFAIREFGTHDKSALLTGVYVVLALICAAAGVLARRHLTAAGFIAAGFGVIGILAAATRPAANTGSLFPSLCAGAVAVWVLLWLTRLAAESAAEDAGPTERRRFLGALLGAAAGAAVGGFGAKSWIDSRYNAAPARAAVKIPVPARPLPPVTAATHPDVPGLGPFFTPNASFYRVDTALSVPQIDPSKWMLRIRGMVARPLELTFEQLLKLPLEEHDLTLTCVSNPVGGPYCGNARWIGTPLAPLLRQAGVRTGADQILATSSDGMTIGTPVNAVLDGREAMLAVAMNGQALPIEHGFPCRMLVPGLYGYVSATKWVVDLELTTFASSAGYWVARGWAQQAPVKTASRIDVPGDGASVSQGTVTLAGTAWATHRGVAAVEVRIDGQWREAALAASDTPDTWRQWSYKWENAPRGSHRVAVRATDGTGTVQTSAVRDVVPDGASGYHEITVNAV
ncbi:molybdopterin-dependent oxidoreductase [Actinocrinis puniceicyclus]|uniref:Molybdopterin-dependent oxidoreductase n=1 Tax=Actinocrinis puniceicyclus TaxID=977794 RepID=A0A8J7WK39_9ACTN|nr:molybdopterin-dependent oxidoreductase [Actinocrinis puniceicyclus]MBS2963731.1 molybdopterin-dependent oxidoreductase [Actinocrinis puniceicyclus]